MTSGAIVVSSVLSEREGGEREKKKKKYEGVRCNKGREVLQVQSPATTGEERPPLNAQSYTPQLPLSLSFSLCFSLSTFSDKPSKIQKDKGF
jgi:hypothetical protein